MAMSKKRVREHSLTRFFVMKPNADDPAGIPFINDGQRSIVDEFHCRTRPPVHFTNGPPDVHFVIQQQFSSGTSELFQFTCLFR